MNIQLMPRSSEPVSIGDPLTFPFLIKNNDNRAIPASSRLWIQDDRFLFEDSTEVGIILPYKEKTVKVTVQTKGGITWRDIPATYTAVLKDGTQVISTCTTSYRMQTFCGSLINVTPPQGAKFVNILTCGFYGAGKSSFINTVLNVFRGSDTLVHDEFVGGGAEHNTSTYTPVPIEGAKIRIFDTWGIDEKNYKGGELEAIVSGLMPGGFSMDDNVRDYYSEMMKHQDKIAARIPHAILFFVPFALLDDDTLTKMMKSQLEKIRNSQFNAFVIVARLDEIAPELRVNPNKQLAAVDQYRQKASTALGVPLGMVRYSVPYTVEQTRSFEIERLCFGIINDAVVAGLSRAKTRGPAKPTEKKKLQWE